ncbi:hypothetical protein GQ473_06140 [archaeon]|nr:hypothetical protein [archaeon]
MSETKEDGTCDLCGNIYKKYVSGWDEYTQYNYQLQCKECGYDPKLSNDIKKIIKKNTTISFCDGEQHINSSKVANLIEDRIKIMLKNRCRAVD